MASTAKRQSFDPRNPPLVTAVARSRRPVPCSPIADCLFPAPHSRSLSTLTKVFSSDSKRFKRRNPLAANLAGLGILNLESEKRKKPAARGLFVLAATKNTTQTAASSTRRSPLRSHPSAIIYVKGAPLEMRNRLTPKHLVEVDRYLPCAAQKSRPSQARTKISCDPLSFLRVSNAKKPARGRHFREGASGTPALERRRTQRPSRQKSNTYRYGKRHLFESSRLPAPTGHRLPAAVVPCTLDP